MVRGPEIRHVLTTGRRARRPHLDICWAPGPAPYPRFGLVVPRLGESAVARNRLRRRLKELWRRELRHRVGPFDVVVRAGRASYRATFAELRDELLDWAAGVAE